MSTTEPTNRPAWLALAPWTFLALWSAGYPVAKIGLRHAEPLTLLSMRYALVLVLMLPLALILRPPPPRRAADWGHLVAVGFLIQVAYFGFSYLAFANGVSAGGVAIIVSMRPILVGILAPMLAGERTSWLNWFGLLLGLAGSATVIIARSTVAVESPVGIACAVLALVGMTVGTLYEKRLGGGQHPVIANLAQYAVGLAGVLPLAWWFETMRVTPNLELAGALAYLAIGNSILAISLLLAMIRHGEVSKVSALLYLVPPGAALIAWFALGEVIPPLGWVGMAVAAAGVYLATRSNRRK